MTLPYPPQEVTIEPRGLTREQAAKYAGCATLSAFDDWVRRGIVPGPIPGTHRWDKRAIDTALDRLSGLTPTLAPTPLEEWRAARARRSQGTPYGQEAARERED